jgi:flavin-dependent dehydrogenase
MPKRISVAVLGGGPAGSAAAIRCAQAGFDVTLIEAEPFPRYRPGETLHPGVEPLFEQLGVAERVSDAGFLRTPGIRVDTHFEAYGADETGPWLGFQATRSVLDSILLERAAECGARVLQPARARELIVRDGRVGGVVTESGEARADYTLDATGHTRWLARRLGLRDRVYSPRYLAQFGYATGTSQEIPSLRRTEDGWLWLAQVGPRLFHWTRLLTTERFDRTWRPPEFASLRPVGESQARDVTWTRAERLAGPGWFLLGDAAVTLDPASSHGVLRALMSGIMAAHCIPNASGLYEGWLLEWFHHDVSKLREARPASSLPAWKEKP